MNPESIIKKKIQLYVSESGAQKSAKYYRIPTPSDSMEYSRENNAYKDCVRWYAKVSADRIYYAIFTKLTFDVAEKLVIDNIMSSSSKSNSTIVNTPSIQAITPHIPNELLNDGESSFETNVYNSFVGYDKNIQDTHMSSDDKNKLLNLRNIKANGIFRNSGTIVSDTIADLSSVIPDSWVQVENIDHIIKELKEWSSSQDAIDRGLFLTASEILNYGSGVIRLNENSLSSLYYSYGIGASSKIIERFDKHFDLDDDFNRGLKDNLYQHAITNNNAAFVDDTLILKVTKPIEGEDLNRNLNLDSELVCAYKTKTGEYGTFRYPYKTLFANDGNISIANFSKYSNMCFVDKTYLGANRSITGIPTPEHIHIRLMSKYINDLSDPKNRINTSAPTRIVENVSDFSEQSKTINKTTESLLKQPIEFNIANVTNIKDMKINYTDNDHWNAGSLPQPIDGVNNIDISELTFLDILFKDGTVKNIPYRSFNDKFYSADINSTDVDLPQIQSIILHVMKSGVVGDSIDFYPGGIFTLTINK